MAVKRAHLWIEGRVQGVFYRAWTRQMATGLGLKGWVKNLPDGRVEAVFEGPEEKVQEAIKHCWQGPPAARVTDIDIQWEEPEGDYKGFEIRYY
ncbi:MAG: acylphosphatase [Nitrospirae bacterium]|nr:MAG: acylphosphatase [Nitrospirota bacterium]